MNKAVNNEQLDADILQCRADILRARNTTPHNDPTPENPETQNETAEVIAEEIPVSEAPPPPKPAVSMQEAEITEETPEIPRFDLAEEIMAEQRKITAIRRRAPGKNEVQRLRPQTRPAEHSAEQSTPSLSQQDKIIAEIVARDIEKLCQG